MQRPESRARNGEALVKAEAHKFDAGEIFTLRLTGRSLSTIYGLHNCRSLTELNLSGNNISRIEGLEALEQLVCLDLSSNQIAEVGGIWHCTKLQVLKLQDNALTDLRSLNLKQLKELPALRAVYLQDLNRTRQNGCCRQPGYKAAMLQALPKLSNLDGERCPHSLNYSELAAEMADFVSKPPPPKQLEVPEVPPWLAAANLDLGAPQKDPELDKAGAKLVRSLDECHALSSVLQEEIVKCERALKESAAEKAKGS